MSTFILVLGWIALGAGILIVLFAGVVAGRMAKDAQVMPGADPSLFNPVTVGCGGIGFIIFGVVMLVVSGGVQ